MSRIRSLRLRWRKWRWDRHWARHREVREEGERFALTPRPPGESFAGERAGQFEDRLELLRLRYVVPMYTAISEEMAAMGESIFDEFERQFGPLDQSDA